MCGIVGYIGKKNASEIVLEGLKKLEYRGYDSFGICSINNEKISLIKKVGKISEEKNVFLKGNIAIGHTRWATTGDVCEKNAHPHEYMGFYVVHNGIIENYKELKEELIKKGNKFSSNTDTEIIAHLIASEFKNNLEDAVQKALKKIIGSYAIAVISEHDLGKIVVAKLSSPLIIGISDDEYIIASDPSAIVKHTKKIINLDDNEIAILTQNSCNVIANKEIETIDFEEYVVDKKGYEHYMLKEIMEEPQVIEKAILGRLLEDDVKLGGLEEAKNHLKNTSKVLLIGCGTGYYAAKIGEYLIESIAGISTEAHFGSELRYRNINLDPTQTAIFVSQSGETADNLAALKKIKQMGVWPLGITNVVGSTQTRETRGGVYTRCGPEISVASTKALIGQIAVLEMIAIFLAKLKNKPDEKIKTLIKEFKIISTKAEKILENGEIFKELALKYSGFKNFWFIGRKFNYPVAMEGALKLKEISYVHAEGVAGGELKHGPLALVEENFPTIAICPQDSVYEKMIANIEEIKARKGKVIAIATEGDTKIKEIADDVIYIPKTEEELYPLLTIIPLHLFAYYFAVVLGNDVDKPRNLAKSVTVE